MWDDEDDIVPVKENLHHFKYKIRKFVGYRKIAETANYKTLKKCKLDGFTYLKTISNVIHFNVNNQLYRKLKLCSIDNSGSKMVNFLNHMISKSESYVPEEKDGYKSHVTSTHGLGSWTIYTDEGEYNYCDYDEEKEVIRERKREQRNRLNRHNNLYKQRMKK